MSDEQVEETVEEKKKEKAPTKAELAQQEADAVDFTDEVFYGEGKTEEDWPKLSRAAAVLLGFRRYFTGEPCKNGHTSPRKTKSSTCLVCSRERLRERHKARLQDDPDYKAKQAEKAKARRLRKKEAAAAASPAEPAEAAA